LNLKHLTFFVSYWQRLPLLLPLAMLPWPHIAPSTHARGAPVWTSVV
jgi:hypothetical protein